MNGKIIAGIVVLCVGIILVAILCGLGGYAKGAVHEGVKTRLEYELPDGYKKDPNFEQCYRSIETATFDEEYYMWNLTNLADVLTGAKPDFRLVGPFSYTKSYCEYQHKINEETGILSYKEYLRGWFYMPTQELPSDQVLITNVNPAYLGVLAGLKNDDANLPIAMTGPGLERIITSLQGGLRVVFATGLPSALTQVNDGIFQTVVYRILGSIFASAPNFKPTFLTDGVAFAGIPSWVSYANTNSPTLDTTITDASRDLLLEAWSNGTTFNAFVNSTSTDISTTFSVTPDQASSLLAYTKYIVDLPSYRQLGLSNIYAQWANAPATSYYLGIWEIGLNNGVVAPTEISNAQVAELFNPSGSCSLVNSVSYTNVWLPAFTNRTIAGINCIDLNDVQKQQVLDWIERFTGVIVKGALHTALGNFSDWDNFGYAQWGRLLVGQSLATPAPEIAAFGNDTSCVTYTIAEAQKLLNGSFGMFNSTNVGIFLQTLPRVNATTFQPLIGDPWGLTPAKAQCLAAYLQNFLLAQNIIPQVTQARAGSGLFVTKTVQEWLFTATDPLLKLLGRNNAAGFKSNATQTKEEAEDVEVRIYTGKNDLHHSLMPVNEGEVLDFWRTNVSITGFNGSQFLPYGYVDDKKEQEKYPLELFHPLINRTIPFQNKGKDEWNGVKVRYLTLSDTALASETINRDNTPYYATYSGAINKTSNPPGLPIFLTTPNFYSAEQVFKENITFNDPIWAPTYDGDDNEFSRHRLSLFILVEPTLGSTVWGNLPIQINLKFDSATLYPNVRPFYAPIYWNAIGDIATPDDLKTVKTDLYDNQRAWKILIGVGVGVGVSFIIAGIVMIHHFKKHENELKDVSMGSTS